MGRKGSFRGDVVKGTAAGSTATWVMGKATTYLYGHERPSARQQEDRARQGKTAYQVAAEKIAQRFGQQLSTQQAQSYGRSIHWALGIGAGITFAALRRHFSHADLARGLVFGTGFWLLADETMVPALHLTPGPRAFPWQTHARGLAGHLVYGLVADRVLDILHQGKRRKRGKRRK